jgi:hypothetical protein
MRVIRYIVCASLLVLLAASCALLGAQATPLGTISGAATALLTASPALATVPSIAAAGYVDPDRAAQLVSKCP